MPAGSTASAVPHAAERRHAALERAGVDDIQPNAAGESEGDRAAGPLTAIWSTRVLP